MANMPLKVDANGGALTYGVIYNAGALGGVGNDIVIFQNFTFSSADLRGL